MPNNLLAIIDQKNSRIRQGLYVDAPVYQPGHETRVFLRVKNISNNVISIKQGDLLAAIRFEKLTSEPNNIYNGAFVDELNYKNLGSYESKFRS